MPVTTLIDIGFRYGSYKPINVEDRIVVPLGNRVAWRLITDPGNASLLVIARLEIYFPYESPFRWRRNDVDFRRNFRGEGIVGQELQAGTADSEGEFKYGIRVAGVGNEDPFNYDEDPYLIIRRF